MGTLIQLNVFKIFFVHSFVVKGDGSKVQYSAANHKVLDIMAEMHTKGRVSSTS